MNTNIPPRQPVLCAIYLPKPGKDVKEDKCGIQ